MRIETEDYVTLEVARLFKEKGYDGMCTACYYDDKLHPIRCWNQADMFEGNFYAAPTLYEAQKWLRKEKGLYVEVSYMTGDYYIYDILTIPQHDLVGLDEPRHFSYPNTYEEVLNAGILEALKLI